MARDALLIVVASALFGVVVWLLALPAGRRRLHSRDSEPRGWWRLVFPLLAGAFVVAFLVGWAFQEPNPADERAGIGLHLLAVATIGIVIRALIRSVMALRSSSRAHTPIGTVGLLAPRVIVSDEFRRLASGDVLRAALAHEAAHAVGRDPLRLWLAQLAADLQWPIPGTGRRLSAWILALEAERDDEAVASGASPEDLAEAILIAARLHSGPAARLCANAIGSGEGIAWRVRRLLALEAPVRRNALRRSFWFVGTSCSALVLAAVWLGVRYGEAVLGVLPGMGR